MKASIIVISYKAEDMLSRCLESIQLSCEYEILVVDNDKSEKALESIVGIPHVIVLPYCGNLGFAGGNNHAIRQSHGEYIITLNADVVLSPSYLDQCIAFLDNHPTVASVQGKLLLYYQRNLIDSTGNAMTSIGFAYNIDHRSPDYAAPTKEIFGVCAAAAVYQKSALDAVALSRDYFDEDFFAYLEDVDLDWRLRLAGYRSFFLGNALAYHVRESSSNSWYRLRQAIRNRYFLVLKNSRTVWMIIHLVIGFPIIFLLPERRSNLVLLSRMLQKRKSIMSQRRVPFSQVEQFLSPIPWALWIRKIFAVLHQRGRRSRLA